VVPHVQLDRVEAGLGHDPGGRGEIAGYPGNIRGRHHVIAGAQRAESG
jgi:hypothetical protein